MSYDMPGLFMGHGMDYWIALQERADRLQVSDLVEEIAKLHAKVSYYETRLADMERFRIHVNGA